MQTTLHRSEDRGYANHGWLEARHSFSFAGYYDPARVHFGVLRVLNDDIIDPSRGFGMHPHENMEIITIPLSGSLRHEDSMGHNSVIRAGEIQVMSAGSGIMHSEFNASDTEQINLLQIWLFPNKRNVTPRYDQQQLDSSAMHNNWLQILSPSENDAGVWIHQQAWFHMATFDAGISSGYTFRQPGNGLYLFVIEGSVAIADTLLKRRDAIGISGTESVDLHFRENSKVLLMEVPMG